MRSPEDKDTKPVAGMSNYSMTMQEKRDAESSVNQLLARKSEISEWTAMDVS